jgi:UDP-GlcNAc:undecaprenyl-phosphate GlcNAc-1-phosphate transferase
MNPVIGFVIGFFVTVVLVPPMTRAARILGLNDKPDAYKIHTWPTPCVGGFGILAGVFLTILIWIPLDTQLESYLIAATVVFLGGVWDDRRNLNYKWKFAGQAIPVAIVLHGGILMEHLPFFGFDPVSPWISYPITALFLLGFTNAVNLFDGLDGLAGGCLLLTLSAIAFLANEVGGHDLTLICLATMGAIIGFLYFNTYPAQVFMGDAGSQFLGFTVAVLAILLVEEIHISLNPALPLLLLGLPLLDTLWVLILRISQRRSPFIGDRQHLHYQLLNLGFTHGESVTIIYLVQAITVGSALLLTYQSDLIVVGVFTLECVVFAGLVALALSTGWEWGAVPKDKTLYFSQKKHRWLQRFARLRPVGAYFIEGSISAFLILGALFSANLDQEFSIVALGVAAMMLFAGIFMTAWTDLFTRISVYFASLLALLTFLPVAESEPVVRWGIDIFLISLALCLAFAIRFTRRDLFQVTPQDLLVVFFAIAISILPETTFGEFPIGYLFLRAVVLFYGCEFLVSTGAHRNIGLRVAAFAALVIMGILGWFS